jgi:pyrimidine operon attenuation protein/uracil phosphoribosyltransferase
MHDHSEKVVLDREDMRRTLGRIAHEIVEKNPDGRLALVGIHRRGAILARRLHARVGELLGQPLPLGYLDISFYRDDFGMRGRPPAQPVVHSTELEFPIDALTIVIVDDVLYTGRTARAAIDEIFDYGRPARVQLAVLVDRGHRELPIRPDYVGKNLPTSRAERVNVSVEELDGVDQVAIGPAAGAETPARKPAARGRSATAGEANRAPGRAGRAGRSAA